MLEIGKKAPDFTLPDQDGNKLTLSELKGSWIILYFYPKALTPGCITQACGIRDEKSQLEDLNAIPIGVSGDKTSLLKRFYEKKELNFTLVGDEEHKTLEAYQAWGEKNMYGRKYMGIFRITYIIDPDGKIAYTFPKVKTTTHHNEVIEVLKKLQN